jgi:hypothetical protein
MVDMFTVTIFTRSYAPTTRATTLFVYLAHVLSALHSSRKLPIQTRSRFQHFPCCSFLHSRLVWFIVIGCLIVTSMTHFVASAQPIARGSINVSGETLVSRATLQKNMPATVQSGIDRYDFGDVPCQSASAPLTFTILQPQLPPKQPRPISGKLTQITIEGTNADEFFVYPDNVSPSNSVDAPYQYGAPFILGFRAKNNVPGLRIANVRFKSVDSANFPAQDFLLPISAFKQLRAFELKPPAYVHPDTLEPNTPASFSIPNLINNTGTQAIQWIDSGLVVTSMAGYQILVDKVVPNPTLPGQKSTVFFRFFGASAGRTAFVNVSFQDLVCRDLVRTLPLTFFIRPNPPNITLQSLGSKPITTVNAGRFLCETAPKDTIIQIYNSGQKQLVVTGATITGANEFQIVNPPVISATTPLTVEPETVATFTVRYTPSAGGARTATLNLFSNANNTPSGSTSLTLTALRDSTALVLSSAQIDVGSFEEGATNIPVQTFTIRNAGSVPLSFTAPQTIGAFVIESITPASLQAGQTATATLRFTGAGTAGSYSSTFTFNDACGRPTSLVARATVFKPLPTIGVASPIAFGTLVCQGSASVNVGISNVTRSTGMDLNIRRITLAGRDAAEFQLGQITLPLRVMAGTTFNVPLRFAPRSAGTKQAQVIIESDATNAPTLTVDIAATKDSVSYTLSRTSILWTNLLPNISATDTLSIINTGTKALTWSGSSTINITPAGLFTVESISPSITPPGGGRSLVTVRFSGSAVEQTASAAFADECSNRRTVSLRATILPPLIAGKAVPPYIDQARTASTNGAAVAFNNLLCEPSAVAQFELQNTGGQDLRIEGLQPGSPTFELLSPADISTANPIVLATGRSQTVQVRFTPRGLQDSVVFAPLIVRSNSANSTMIQASGMTMLTSTSVTLSARKDFLDFVTNARSLVLPPVPPNTARDTTIIAYNTGTVPLQWPQTPIPFGANQRFRIESITPNPTPRGGSSTVRVRFLGAPSSNNGANYTADTLIRSNVGVPCEQQQAISLAATVLDATATVELGKVEATPGKFVEVPVYLRRGQYLREAQATDLQFDVRYAATIMVPQDNTPFASGTGTVEGTRPKQERVLPLRVPIAGMSIQGQDTILGKLKFRMTLGTDTLTALSIKNLRPIGTALTVVKTDTVPGLARLTGLCVAGGTRLVSDTESGLAFALAPSVPNPVQDKASITFSVIEAGHTTLVLYNTLGREVARLLDAHLDTGTYQLELDAAQLESGAYVYALQSPTMRLTQHLKVVK